MIRWLYKHYAITGMISVYYMVLIGYGTVQVFSDIGAISAPAASAYLTLMGLPAGAVGLIKWRLSRDNSED